MALEKEKAEVIVVKSRATVILSLLCLLAWSCSEPAVVQHTIAGRTMGTSFSVKIVLEERSALDKSQLERQINELLVEINQQMSTYIDDSLISQFNQSNDLGWFPLPADLATVLRTSLELSELSGGAFDITVGPLVNLWGFGPTNNGTSLPTEEQIADKQAITGFTKIELRDQQPAVRKTVAGIYCDLSAIAKGFAVDKVSMLLNDEGFNRFMVEIGGEVRTGGLNKDGSKWRIGVERPESGGRLQEVLLISDKAMATSGDYVNYFERDGVRYSHTIDPRTGRPITHKLASVTVILESCMLADGYATAINVLGPEDGYAFAVQQELPVLMLVKEGDAFVEKTTPGFAEFIQADRDERSQVSQ